MVTYDVWLRNPMGAIMAKGADETNPDMDTVTNIKIMVERGVTFWNKYGLIIKYGFTFNPKGTPAQLTLGMEIILRRIHFGTSRYQNQNRLTNIRYKC